ncbi:Transport and Golgi organization protein 2 [Coemansia biformis]|uniref:Transport and Golgi organization protein 2 n=1 Tax=Coemansia biformis TaxID=1286918 RepID=A0A9W8CUU7_9FUNG|nr:Transport and Golgi organization protein 2 [Coemansia biformis]
MCVTFWQLADEHSGDGVRFILAFNRDEYFERPTKEFHIWESHPTICAPKDMEPLSEAERGSWIGVNRRGLLAILTNYRGTDQAADGAISRGALVRDFLLETPATPGGQVVEATSNRDIAREYAEKVFQERELYSGFNLVLFDLASEHMESWYVTNRGEGGGTVRRLDRGKPAGLSNSTIDHPWAKVDRGLKAFADIIASRPSPDEHTVAELMWLMRDTGPFSTACPPQRLADLEQCIFVPPTGGPGKGLYHRGYGTRTTHVLLLRECELTIAGCSYSADGACEAGSDGASPSVMRFLIDAPSL